MSDPADTIKSPDPDEALARVQAGEGASGSKAEEADNPRGEESWEFRFEWTHPRTGKVSKGNFKNKILSMQDRVSVGNLKAAMANNTPWDALDGQTQTLLEMMAHLTISLQERPKWCKLSNMVDPDLLYAIYTEVSGHEEFFRGPRTTEEASS